MNRRGWLLLGVLSILAVMAFALRDVIERDVIVPLAYLWWLVDLLYHSFPQLTLWVVLVVGVFLIAVGSFTIDRIQVGGREEKKKAVRGPVEDLAVWLIRNRRGNYFKWVVARRLGVLSREIRLHEARRTAHLAEDAPAGDWNPPREVDAYLESGLNGSFADYPRPRWPWQSPEKTPLDLNPEEAVEFLESELETAHDRRHP
ncbi:MAG: hypothetical protein ACOYZ8_00895 [Chloroflexota bacterium]